MMFFSSFHGLFVDTLNSIGAFSAGWVPLLPPTTIFCAVGGGGLRPRRSAFRAVWVGACAKGTQWGDLSQSAESAYQLFGASHDGAVTALDSPLPQSDSFFGIIAGALRLLRTILKNTIYGTLVCRFKRVAHACLSINEAQIHRNIEGVGDGVVSVLFLVAFNACSDIFRNRASSGPNTLPRSNGSPICSVLKFHGRKYVARDVDTCRLDSKLLARNAWSINNFWAWVKIISCVKRHYNTKGNSHWRDCVVRHISFDEKSSVEVCILPRSSHLEGSRLSSAVKIIK